EALETIDAAGAPHDCLRVLYAGADKLFVPVENIEVLSRFGSEDAGVQLDRLGGVAWQSRKARVKKRIRDIAGELIRVAAERQLRPGDVLQPPEGIYEEFTDRFAGLPLRIAQLSRLVPAKVAREVKNELADGRLDIVIGTHALLAKDIRFAHLGLLIVDEEQHFGVAQKEKLKQLKADVHV